MPEVGSRAEAAGALRARVRALLRVRVRVRRGNHGFGKAVSALTAVTLDMCLFNKFGPEGDKASAVIAVEQVL